MTQWQQYSGQLEASLREYNVPEDMWTSNGTTTAQVDGDMQDADDGMGGTDDHMMEHTQ
jgi:hypothetical protein